jgi:LPS-assembly lipoprotein
MNSANPKTQAFFMRRLISAMLLLALAGCGFHLKGYQQVSPVLNDLYVIGGEARGTLAGVLQRDLRSSGVRLAGDAQSARYRLRITREQMRSRVLSVDASGKALDSELQLLAAYQLTRAAGGEPVEGALELARQLRYSGTDELGRRNEAALLTEEMRRDLASQIIRQLQARLK